jgi:Haemolymph juvenile hormone binding protein (JHBP)
MDWKNNAVIYSQQFPEKSLDGLYELESKILGNPIKNSGNWSLVLYDYSQTTTVKRIGGPGGRLKVNVEIDKIGNMKLHISHLLGGRVVIENIADFLINNAWQPSLPFIKPLINDLVSTAFTDIFNESFRNFPIEKLFKY